SNQIMDSLCDSTASIYFVPESSLFEGFSVDNTEIAGISLMSLHETQMLGLSKALKRLMDIVVAGAMVTVLSPIMLSAAIAVKLSSPGPIIFRQQRYGEDGERINVYKFRSMRVQEIQNGVVVQASKNDDRVTRVGRFLRKSSIDELPQLFNVLKGTMSIVGPRPHAAEHNELYRRQIKGYMLRHTVKPGITGWAQVNGLRGETDTLEKMERRAEFDRYYIRNWSLWLDITILFRTALLVIRDKNAY
ncbi:MAG: exopolysaccharide biosynthesis polyprenyl glycosylphosphotransferase, partial [Comamonadaceae bacterium]